MKDLTKVFPTITMRLWRSSGKYLSLTENTGTLGAVDKRSLVGVDLPPIQLFRLQKGLCVHSFECICTEDREVMKIEYGYAEFVLTG